MHPQPNDEREYFHTKKPRNNHTGHGLYLALAAILAFILFYCIKERAATVKTEHRSRQQQEKKSIQILETNLYRDENHEERK